MPMPFDEAGHGKFSVKRNDFGIRSYVFVDFCSRANVQDTIACNRDRFDDRLTAVHRDDLAAGQDHVGGWYLGHCGVG